MHITHHMLPTRMHNSEDTITSNEDNSPNTNVPAYINKKGDYERSRYAHVASLAYLLKPLQNVTNELYGCNICFVCNE